MGTILQIKNLTKRFGGLTAVNDVSFEVDRGSMIGLIGPNGAGKTTLFNLIAGSEKPNSGSIWFDGINITKQSIYKRVKLGIARTFQIVRPLMDLSLIQNVAIAVMYGRDEINTLQPALQRASQLLKFTRLNDKAHILPGQLALEDRKRLEVARALASKPEIILLDEVFAGLNQKEIEAAIELTFQIRDEFGVTVFMIEHVMKAIMGTCSRVIALHNGVKIADGNLESVANDPEVIQAYLGAGYAGR